MYLHLFRDFVAPAALKREMGVENGDTSKTEFSDGGNSSTVRKAVSRGYSFLTSVMTVTRNSSKTGNIFR